MSAFIATLEITCGLCHEQLGFAMPKRFDLFDELRRLFAFQNCNLFAVPSDKDTLVFTDLIGEDSFCKGVAFIDIGHK